MPQIICEKLSVGYDGQTILSDLDFSVSAGDYLCIIGSNGSGKTTLMKTLLGLQKPLSGSIRFGDRIKQTDIGYLPQQTDVQRDFPASVTEVVLSGCQSRMGLRPFYNRSDKKLAVENMRRMGIEELARRCYRELSGGQQQRVLLARALCAARSVILLDEPVSGLDPEATAEMYSLICSLNQSGITVIMISHDLSSAREYATHILDVGGDLFFGKKDDYIREREYRG